MTTKGFELFKQTGISREQIRKNGLDLSGESVSLDSVIKGRFRCSFGACYQYKITSEDGDRYECAIPQLKEGEGNVCKENIRYKFSSVPSHAYGNWI
jgi:hypothetical protein